MKPTDFRYFIAVGLRPPIESNRMRGMTTIRLVAAATAICLLATGTPTVAQRGRADHWVGTWATAVVPRPQVPPGAAQGRGPAPLNFHNQTLRQVVHVSLGGSRLRVILSNAFGTSPLAIGGASVALRIPCI